MSRIQGRPLRLYSRIIAPIRWPFEMVVRLVTPASRAHGHELLTEDDFVELLGQAVREKTGSPGEAEMIEAVFRLKDTAVRALMTGRPDMVALPMTATVRIQTHPRQRITPTTALRGPCQRYRKRIE